MKTVRLCELCKEPLEEDSLHEVSACQSAELLKARKEIKELKASVSSWKEAWYECRDVIGRLWWHHPAIDNDDSRSYYQNRSK